MGLVLFVCTSAVGAFEQIRNFGPCFNLKITAVHDSACEDGTACLRDFALMRSIPGMAVLCPADDVKARSAVRAAYKYQGPACLRFSKTGGPDIP